MAAGDPYFNCDNNNNFFGVLADMIVQDASGNPAWRVYGAGGSGGGLSGPETDENTSSINDYTLTTTGKTIDDIAMVFVDGNLQLKSPTADYIGVGNVLTFSYFITGLNIQIFYK